MDLCKFISYNPRDYFVPMTDEDYESLSPRDKVVDENGGIALVCSKAGFCQVDPVTEEKTWI